MKALKNETLQCVAVFPPLSTRVVNADGQREYPITSPNFGLKPVSSGWIDKTRNILDLYPLRVDNASYHARRTGEHP
jgi:hypothetical protein